MRIAFLVTHLLGTGHLARTAKIADAFATVGHDALVVSGGMPAPLVAPKVARFQQVAAVRSDATFNALYDAEGAVVEEAFLARRAEAVAGAVAEFAPDALVTELYPFGRRKLAKEFEAGIVAAAGARIFASVRDILQAPRKAGRKEVAEARLAASYDGVLLHGDSTLIGLEESWPGALGVPVLETGYIGEAVETPGAGDGTGEIVVAAGGGAVGTALFDAALDAARGMPKRRWRMLVGGAIPADVPGNVVVEGLRSDFRALLGRCEAAVLQCGYNTAMDVAATGARAVFCPFEGDGETEQLMRARAMGERYGCGLVREGALDGATLAMEIEAVLGRGRPDFSGLRLDGAARTVALVEGMA